MTEQQFEKLKQSLDKTAKPSPSALDDAIFSIAKSQIEQNLSKEPVDDLSDSKREKSSWFLAFFQTSFAQSVFVSVALTVAVFGVLAFLITPEQHEPSVVSDSKHIEFDLVAQTQSVSKVAKYRDSLAYFQSLSVEMPQTQQGRDAILANTPLPDVQVLLDEMNFSADQDLLFTESVISLAMKDIRILIDDNNLEGARVRYARLKGNCASCPLPESLEALLIVTSLEST